MQPRWAPNLSVGKELGYDGRSPWGDTPHDPPPPGRVDEDHLVEEVFS